MTTAQSGTLAAMQASLDAHLADADAALARTFPGESSRRQPVHTVYMSADRYDARSVRAWGDQALAALDGHGDDEGFATAIGLTAGLADQVMPRVRAKLLAEPVEDLRIDFEDGYGARPDAEENAAVDAAVGHLIESTRAEDSGARPAHVGLRFKSFEAPTRARGLSTLHRFVSALGSRLPDGFVLTLPKVTSVEQVEAMVMACEALEAAEDLAPHALVFEIQVETPQAILGPDGAALIARMIHAAQGRCTGLHYGTYDYSASLGIAAGYQSLEHPVADHAKAVMQVAAAGTGVHLSDGSTNVIPVGSSSARLQAWALHARLVRRSLERGYYQGWDMHPAHLPTRYAATYAFFRDGLPVACQRLADYLGTISTQPDGDASVMDEPATAKALAAYVVRALDCGATDVAEIRSATGADEATLRRLGRSARNG